MKKVFMVLVAALVLGAASMSAQNRLTLNVGLGGATVVGIDDDIDPVLNLKLGASYEFRISHLFGIEPGIAGAFKGCSWGDEDSDQVNLGYVGVPVMFNFHLGDHFVIAPGAYAAGLCYDDDTNAKSFDFGFKAAGKYVFDSGINIGIDLTAGATDVFETLHGNHVTAAVVFGYSF